MVFETRREIPRVGTMKLYIIINKSLIDLKIGRNYSMIKCDLVLNFYYTKIKKTT